jgi:hypothetical protein
MAFLALISLCLTHFLDHCLARCFFTRHNTLWVCGAVSTLGVRLLPPNECTHRHKATMSSSYDSSEFYDDARNAPGTGSAARRSVDLAWMKRMNKKTCTHSGCRTRKAQGIIAKQKILKSNITWWKQYGGMSSKSELCITHARPSRQVFR